MANPTSRVRGTGGPARRGLTAAARAAAKRAGRSDVPQRREGVAAEEERLSGRTVVIDAPDGWDDPPEPALESPEPGEPGDSGDSDGSGERSPGPVAWLRGRLPAVVLSLVLVVALAAVAVLGWQYGQGRRAEAARGEALAAARKAAPVVLSYDYRHLDRDFARARGHLTGKFRNEYGRTTKTVVAPTAEKYRGVVKATVVAPPDGGSPAASVVSASPDRVVVLLFVNQVTKSTQVSGSRLDLNRVRMTMSHTSQGWKVSAVDAL
jgi:Mce-associated membrane protein